MKLDKNCVYSLEDLTSEEWNMLIPVLKEQSYYGYNYQNLDYYKQDSSNLTLYYNEDECWVVTSLEKPTHNAKELFYTLENVQVDCRYLTREQIKDMAKISGYKKGNLECYQHYNYFRIAYNTCNVGVYEESKTTIIYDKFMELFTPQYEVTDKPKHYSKGIDTFSRMEANCTKEECLAFAKGNIDKYNWRNKGQDLEDYKKIVSYANWAIKLLTDEK